ncbi:bifunctional DNA primase/polymerase [Streptomyces rhizosphaericola]|uniref:bifunctional DNA primase/polymerase n=1 Tax=Streptomyces rhizosphaericola TaxID=2564098 RepID=UPI003BF4CEEC
MNPHLAAALHAAERNWHVFPLRPADKRPALHSQTLCPRTGACAEGHRKPEQRATIDPARIRRAWSAGPYNVGVATGPSGLIVVDLDTVKAKDPKGTPDGVTSLQALCERAGHTVPTTYRVRTASGGHHLYFTAPEGIRLGNSAGKLGKHIDTRAHGGYVVAAGSTLPLGAYEVTDPTDPVPLPRWLQRALQPPSRPTPEAPAPQGTRAKGYAAAALRGELRNVTTAADGTRNTTLLRAARALGRLIASGDLSRTEVEQALSRAASGNATQSQRYYDDVIRRGLDWSITHNPVARARA